MGDVTLSISIDDIIVGEGRDVVTATVKRLADSISRLGLQHPITVKRQSGKYKLIAGRHRLEAFKKLDRDFIPAHIVSMSADESRLWEIAENLHRAELSNIERAEAIEEWRAITARAGNSSPPKGGEQPSDLGIRKTAEALGVDKRTVANARRIASIVPEAKRAADEAGVGAVRELLEVSKEEPARQTTKVQELAAKRAERATPKTSFQSARVAGRDEAVVVAQVNVTEVAGLANAIRIGLIALDPILDRVFEIGDREFWENVQPRSSRDQLFGALDGIDRLERIKRTYDALCRRGKIYHSDVADNGELESNRADTESDIRVDQWQVEEHQ